MGKDRGNYAFLCATGSDLTLVCTQWIGHLRKGTARPFFHNAVSVWCRGASGVVGRTADGGGNTNWEGGLRHGRLLTLVSVTQWLRTEPDRESGIACLPAGDRDVPAARTLAFLVDDERRENQPSFFTLRPDTRVHSVDRAFMKRDRTSVLS